MQDYREDEMIQDEASRTAPGRVSASGLSYNEDEDDEAGVVVTQWRGRERWEAEWVGLTRVRGVIQGQSLVSREGCNCHIRTAPEVRGRSGSCCCLTSDPSVAT